MVAHTSSACAGRCPATAEVSSAPGLLCCFIAINEDYVIHNTSISIEADGPDDGVLAALIFRRAVGPVSYQGLCGFAFLIQTKHDILARGLEGRYHDVGGVPRNLKDR
jgi:hypothetical protein